jgi:serine protease Do
LFSFIAGGIGVAIGKNMGKDDSTPSVPSGDLTTAPNNTVIMQETDVSAATVENATTAAVVQKCAPSVVEIIITPHTNNSYEAKSGAGSGVIIGESEDGNSTYIVTNNHVIEGADKIVVRLKDGTE